jgi:hypothetical protein
MSTAVFTAAVHVSSLIYGVWLSLRTLAGSVDIERLDLDSGYGGVVLDGLHVVIIEVEGVMS